MNDLLSLLKKNKIRVEDSPLKPEVVGFISRRIEAGELSKRKGRELLIKWFNENLEKSNYELVQ